jgi:hypothetical protein
MKTVLNVQVRNFATGSITNNSISFDVFVRIYHNEFEVVENSVKFKLKSSKHKFIYISCDDWQRFLQWRRMKVLDLLV